MAVWADFETNDGADGAEVRFSGRLTLARMGDLPQRLDELGPISLLDLSNITRIDTVGAWIVSVRAPAGKRGICAASHTRKTTSTPAAGAAAWTAAASSAE